MNSAHLSRLLSIAAVAAGLALSLAGCGKGAAGSTGDAGDGSNGASDAGTSGTSQPEADGGGQTAPDAGGEPDAGGPAADAGTPLTREHASVVGGPGPAPGAIAGLHYRSGRLEGTTDTSGAYDYESGQPTTFILGRYALATLAPAARRSPFALAGSGDCILTIGVRRLAVLLETLDADRDPTNGIQLPNLPTPATVEPLSLGTMTAAQFSALLNELAPGAPVADETAAVHRFIRQVDAEEWSEIGTGDQFSTSQSATRGQGIASDGQSVWFSWTLGLERTDMQFNHLGGNDLAIPSDMAAPTWLGGFKSNHIGDLDVLNGTLYTAIDDTAANQHPYVVLYDAMTLKELSGKRYPIPASLLLGGIAWIAVDGPRQLAYTDDWDNAPGLLVFDLATFTYQRTIPFEVPLSRVQGAKVWRGALYANGDTSTKEVYKVDLESGTVMSLFSRPRPGIEAEGIAFWDRADGSQMHVTNVNESRNAMEAHHYQRTKAPLREEICPGG